MTRQCKAMCQDRHRCTRNTDTGSLYCFQHKRNSTCVARNGACAPTRRTCCSPKRKPNSTS